MTWRATPRRFGAVRLQMAAVVSWLQNGMSLGNPMAAPPSVPRPTQDGFKRRTMSLVLVPATCQQQQGRESRTNLASLGLRCRRQADRRTCAGGRTNPQTSEFQFGIKMPTKLVGTFEENLMNVGGVDGARTRDPRRDRPVF